MNPDPAPSAQDDQAESVRSSFDTQATTPQHRGDMGPLEDLILGRLEDDQAQDVVFIDLKGKSAVADALIVASGRSHRHVGAIADHLLRALKENGYGRARVEGMPHCDWVLIDTGDVVIHLFRPEVRSFYNIEKIWSVDSPGHRTDVSPTLRS
ncbi:ribosome silencing factor [Phenylobacterium immobile]|uniref:ribosome silencing factor n=1 Tax=Phenylobacterium immobile TaxID=21 RepID=UPI003CCBD18F